MRLQLSRRAATAALISTVNFLGPLSAPAVPSASTLAPIVTLRTQLQGVNALLSAEEGAAALAKASAVLDGSIFEPSAMQRAFDAYTDQPSAKETAMNNAAFIVYYEERRYGDLRLEPQVPGKRAEQNGFKKEAMRAIADMQAEAQFLRKDGTPDDREELVQYGQAAQRALDNYLKLALPEDCQNAGCPSLGSTAR